MIVSLNSTQSLNIMMYNKYIFVNNIKGLVVASATVEQGVLGSIPGSDKVLLGFSIRDCTSNIIM